MKPRLLVSEIIFIIYIFSNCTAAITTNTENSNNLLSNLSYGNITLIRDQWGVPNVFADTDAGAMYGLGYVTAQDRAFQMYYNLRIIQGRLAETVGNVIVGVTRQRPQGTNSALLNDIKMRTIGYYRYAQQTAANLSAEQRELMQAYCDGVNDYIKNHPDDLLYLFDEYDLEPEIWTPADCIASWWRLGLFFAGDGLGDMTLYYNIMDGLSEVLIFDPSDEQSANAGFIIRDDASVIQRSDVSDTWVQEILDYAVEHGLTRKVVQPVSASPSGPRFSHAWIIGQKKTSSGSAVLVSDPQTPVRNPSLFYEYHVCGQTFNARGIGVAGCPNILIGFTDRISWGLTALGADQADLFVLKSDSAHPNQYLFDGIWRDIEVRDEIIKIKGQTEHSLTVKSTHLGPVVTSLVNGIRNGDEVVLKRVPIDDPNHQSFEGVLAMMRSDDIYQFQQALSGWRFPSANCVFGDYYGSIGYQTIFACPVRSAESLADGRAAHDGWIRESDWQEILPAELLPQVIDPNQGWIVTANHRPIASFYPIYLGNSTGSLGDTGRSWRLKEMIAQQGMFTPEQVLDLHYDMTNPVKRDIVSLGFHLRDIQQYALQSESLLALEHLESWFEKGAKSEMTIPGTALVNSMSIMFRQNFEASAIYGGGGSGLVNMMQTITSRLQADSNAVLTEPEAVFVDVTLADAWQNALNNYGPNPTSWLRKAYTEMTETRIGYFTTLDGFESLDRSRDVNTPALQCIDGGTILSQKSQSFTQYVPMHDINSAMTLLPPGQSEHPDSPYYLNNMDLWKTGYLHPAPLTLEALTPYIASQVVISP